MSCKNCDCSECESARDYNSCWDTEAPIHRPTWRDVEPANEVQAKAWMGYINEVFDQYPGKAINLPTMIYMAAGKIPGLRDENHFNLTLQLERFIRESPSFELRKGKAGGVFRRKTYGTVAESVAEMYSTPIPNVVSVVINNHTCKSCGNTKLNSQEKSCWKCGTGI